MSATNAINMRLSLTGIAQIEGGLKSLQSGLSRVHTVMGRITALAPGLASALSAGAIINFTKQAIDAADAAGKLAQRAGQATDSISRWSYAASLADAETDSLKTAMRDLSKHLQDQGRSGADLSEELLSIADRMRNASGEAERLAIATSLPGRQWQNLIPLLSQGSEELRKQMAEADRFGVTIGSKFAANAQQFNDNLTRLNAAFRGIWLQVADNVLPALVTLSEKLVIIARDGDTARNTVFALTGAFHALHDSASRINDLSPGALERIKNVFTSFLPPSIFIGKVVFDALAEYGRQAALAKDIADKLGASLAAIVKSVSQSEPAKNKEDFESARKVLDIKIQQNRVLEENIRMRTEGRVLQESEVRLIRQRFEDERTLLNQKYELTKLAREAKVISQDEADSLNIQDDQALLSVESRDLKFSDPNSVIEQTRLSMRSLRAEFGTLAQQIGRGFTNVIGTAVSSVSNSINGLIQGTMTWGDALRNVGSAILTTVINAIVEMFAAWIVGRLAVKSVEVSSATAEAAAKMPGALATSISSYGAAAAIGVAALIAALAAVSFDRGGYTGNAGTKEAVGVVHGQEFVMPAEATNRIGVPVLEAMKDGAPVASTTGNGDVNIYNVWNETELRQRLFNSRDGRKFFVSMMSENLHRFRR